MNEDGYEDREAFKTHPGFVTTKLSYSCCPDDDYLNHGQNTTTVETVDAALPLHKQKGFKQVINIFENILQLGTADGLLKTKLLGRYTEDFLLHCREGLFVLESVYAIGFFNTLPKEIAACVQSVVITSALLYADDYDAREVWSKEEEDASTPFTTALKDTLPNLREVSFFLPADISDFCCTYATIEICELRTDGTIDVVRVMGTEDRFVKDDWTLDNQYLMTNIIRGECPDHFPEISWEERMNYWRKAPDIIKSVREESICDASESIRRFGWSQVKGSFILTRHSGVAQGFVEAEQEEDEIPRKRMKPT